MKKRKAFCCFCGSGVTQRHIEGKWRDYCERCDTVFYENPLPVASSIVVNEEREVLLVRRKNEPYRDMWCLPIGFAETGEEIREAALRELQEEAGVRGEIVRLIDVDTVENYFYGSLAIVTYEVRLTEGVPKPGDDAADARYFPLDTIPPLAWSSNEKAIGIFLDLYRESWAMIDSFRHLFPGMESIADFTPPGDEQGVILSNVLIQMIDRDRKEITRRWREDLRLLRPTLEPHLALLTRMNDRVLRSVEIWLADGTEDPDFKIFIDFGRTLAAAGVSLPDMLTAMALSRKSIWDHVTGKNILNSPLEIYAALELNNRIIFLYDKINYYLTLRYVEQLC